MVSNKQVQGITIEPNTGKVEISYQHNQKVTLSQQKQKAIVMKVEKVKQLCQRKEDIPPPTVSANVEQANVNVVNDDSKSDR